MLGRVTVAASPEAVAVRGDQPYFTTNPTELSHQGGTLRIASDRDSLPSGVDPTYASVEDVTGGRLFLTTNDGLIAYRRVGGIDGQQLVSDLATSIPSPTDGGLTYRFQLRSRTTYSDGEPLRASDVLRTAARAFAAAPTTQVNPFVGVRGSTDACATPGNVGAPGETASVPASSPTPVSSNPPCDLADGIVTTTTLEPSRSTSRHPIRTFCTTSPNPGRSSSRRARRSCGARLRCRRPDRISRSADPTGVHLKRNSRFHVWSSDAQPDGFPDAIEWTADPDPVGAVIAGRADWTPDALTPDQLSTVETTLTTDSTSPRRPRRGSR